MLKSLKKPIRCFKRTKRPKRTILQKAYARPKCRRMYMKYRQHEFVMDDESYFTLSNTTLTGNNTYYSSDRRLTPADVSYWEKAKFEEKLLLWIVVSSKGIGQIYIALSKQAFTWKNSSTNIIMEINMHFGPTWRLHIMRIRYKTGLKSTASAFWQKKTIQLICQRFGL